MPCLKYIIQNANTNELKLLRGKTIECVSLIGLAVGNEKVSLVGIGSIERRFFIMAIIKSQYSMQRRTNFFECLCFKIEMAALMKKVSSSSEEFEAR